MSEVTEITSQTEASPSPEVPPQWYALHVLSGQELDVTYTVNNVGPGGTPPRESSWIDYLYLSADPFLDLSGEDIRRRMYLTTDPSGRVTVQTT